MMHLESGKEWSELLKSAVLCMNSTYKKSHGTTPFRVMWGRDSRYEELVPSISNASVSAEDDFAEEDAILSLCDSDIYSDITEDIYSLPIEQPIGSIANLKEYRESTYKFAHENTTAEQMKQKIQYDKKVNQNRFVSL